MPSSRITVTVENDQLREIRALVKAKRAASTSAFVKHAIGVALEDATGWSKMLDEALEKTGGPLTDQERAWADEILTGKPRRPARRRIRKT